MSQAAVAEHDLGIEPAESPLTPESWGKLGMWVFLAADAMSFGGLLAGYGALRYGDPTWPVPKDILGVQLTAFMTFLLICSSVTMVEALAAIRQGDQRGLRRFLMLTVMGGMTFLGLQAFEWTKLILHEGQSIARNNFGATFFILTGFHGCHVFGGVTYLSAVLGRSVRGASLVGFGRNGSGVGEDAGEGPQVGQEREHQQHAEHGRRQRNVGERPLLDREVHEEERHQRRLGGGQDDQHEALRQRRDRRVDDRELDRGQDHQPGEHLEVAPLLVRELLGRVHRHRPRPS